MKTYLDLIKTDPIWRFAAWVQDLRAKRLYKVRQQQLAGL